MNKTREYDQKLVDKISGFINAEYLKNAELKLKVKSDNTNSIRICLSDNDLRGGAVNGFSFFASIKSSGKNPHIAFKEKFSCYFEHLNIPYTAGRNQYIQISLSDFLTHLDNPSSDFIDMLNILFLKNIHFREFACCSRYQECKEQGKCLHTDKLYSTVCQRQREL